MLNANVLLENNLIIRTALAHHIAILKMWVTIKIYNSSIISSNVNKFSNTTLHFETQAWKP